MSADAKNKIALSRKIAYALPAGALAVVGIPVYVYLPKFYTDVVGVDVATLGYILFSVRVYDAVTDPAMGYLSDLTRSVFGRRRPYIALGSFLVAAMMFMLFNPPEISSEMDANRSLRERTRMLVISGVST